MCGLQFNGSNQEVNCGNITTLNSLSAITIMAWVWTEDSGAGGSPYGGIVAKGAGSSSGETWRMSWTGSTWTFVVRSGGSSANVNSVTNIEDGNWHLLVGTWDKSVNSGKCTVYTDLNKVISTTGITTDLSNVTTPVQIARYNYANRHFAGKIFDVRAYNRALSLAEIQTLYHSRGSDNIVNGLVGRWLMNEKSDGSTATVASSVIDISGNGNDGTPANSPIYVPAPTKLIKRPR